MKTTTTKQVVLNQQNEKSSEQPVDDKKVEIEKSPGAQVAEIIDKLVAQRGKPSSVVVVAPFKLRNGNKKITLTEGNIHNIPQFGVRSVSAQNLASLLNNGNNKQTTTGIKITTIQPTQASTSEEMKNEVAKSASNDEEGDKKEKSEETEKDTENKSEEKDEKSGNKENEKPSEEEKNNESDKKDEKDDENKEGDEATSESDDEKDEDEEETSTTVKPVLINRIKEAVRSKKEKQAVNRRENQKKNEQKSNNKLTENASMKDNDKEQPNKPKRARKRNKQNADTNQSKLNHGSKKNSSTTFLISDDENIRRMDDEIPEKLITMDLSNEEGLFLKDGFLKKTTSLEKAFKEHEKSKNLKYSEHEFTHQSKEKESYFSSSSNNHKQTVKPLMNLQSITQPSASPPPHPQINQHFLVNQQKSQNRNNQNNNHKNNQNNNQNNFNKQFMNTNQNLKIQPPYSNQFKHQDHRKFNNNKPNVQQKFMNANGKRNAPAPASFNYQQMNNNNNKKHVNFHSTVTDFETQQTQHQKQMLNQLLQANAASTNQIQRSMNVNSNVNQLSHLKLPPAQQQQRSVHIPKQQLIQHIQMLSNLNSKHTFPMQQQNLPHQPHLQNAGKIMDFQQPNMNLILPTPSIGPDQLAELNQMMDVKLTPSALAAAQYQHDQQNLRNLQNMENNNGNNGFMNDHILNMQNNKPQIHYADQMTDPSNINPTNQPPSQTNNLQAAESVGHSQHSPSSNVLSVGDSSNSAVVNFDLKEPPQADKGLHMSFGSGPSSGGAQLITNPLGIFKSLFLPLLPKPRMNLNGKVVFGVVLDTSLKKPAPKYSPPVIVVPPHKPHHFFG